MGEQVAARLLWGCSSVGRAPALQAGGQEFESLHLHVIMESIINHRTLKTAYREKYPMNIFMLSVCNTCETGRDSSQDIRGYGQRRDDLTVNKQQASKAEKLRTQPHV